MKKIILILFIITILLMSNVKKDIDVIPKESIRFRVIANSDNPKDQLNKMQLIHDLYPTLISSTKHANNIETARENIKNSQTNLKPIINKYTDNYKINYGLNYFPEKEFRGKTYAEGNYESLVIELGSGKGENWWCVLFPPLCLLEGEESSEDNIEYKFFVKDMFNKYVK